jgi:hypothetical protein
MSFMAAITCGARRSLIVGALAAFAPVTKKEKKRVERTHVSTIEQALHRLMSSPRDLQC